MKYKLTVKVVYGRMVKIRNWRSNTQMIKLFSSTAITCPEQEAAKEDKRKENSSVSMDRLFQVN